jgi:hypothetical protein
MTESRPGAAFTPAGAVCWACGGRGSATPGFMVWADQDHKKRDPAGKTAMIAAVGVAVCAKCAGELTVDRAFEAAGGAGVARLVNSQLIAANRVPADWATAQVVTWPLGLSPFDPVAGRA